MFMVITSLKQIKSQTLEIANSSEGGKINCVLSGNSTEIQQWNVSSFACEIFNCIFAYS